MSDKLKDYKTKRDFSKTSEPKGIIAKQGKKAILKDLKYYKKYLPKGSKILELGCGLGFKAVPLSSLGYELVGIDSDKRVVESAKKKC